MLNRSIPYHNTILRCDRGQQWDVVLPEGFSIVSYRPGYEAAWAKLEHAVGDFGSPQEAEAYFVSTYLKDEEKTDNILFLLDADGAVAGSCIAWHSPRGDESVAALHWLIVGEAWQGMGLGRALCHAVMNRFRARGSFPVYLHTQPWSWKAILLYLSAGFRLQKSDTFEHYENEYAQAMAALEQVVTAEQFQRLKDASDA